MTSCSSHNHFNRAKHPCDDNGCRNNGMRVSWVLCITFFHLIYAETIHSAPSFRAKTSSLSVFVLALRQWRASERNGGSRGIASQFHGSNSSPQTSVSGQATPTSDSSPDAFNQRRPLPFAATDLSSRAGRAADGDGENGRETYELDEFGSDAIGDGEYGGDDDVKDAHMMDGRSRKKERRRSDSTAASFQLYTPDEERAVVRKFDRRLVIFLAFCYMLSFVDRSSTFFLLLSAFSPSLQWRRGPASIGPFPYPHALRGVRRHATTSSPSSISPFAVENISPFADIGNARIAGMEADLQSRPPREDYFEWALRSFYIAYIAFEWMSLLWRIVPAHIYVSLIVLSWGIIASLQAIVTSYPLLIVLRVLLGIGEAGFTACRSICHSSSRDASWLSGRRCLSLVCFLIAIDITTQPPPSLATFCIYCLYV